MINPPKICNQQRFPSQGKTEFLRNTGPSLVLGQLFMIIWKAFANFNQLCHWKAHKGTSPYRVQ